jgi:acetyl-CoA synthetase
MELVKVPVVPPPAHSAEGAHVASLEAYRALHARSVGPESDAFWLEQLARHLTLFVPPTAVRSGSFERGDVAWFLNAKLNVCFNCVDRHLPQRAQQTALIWEGNDLADTRRVSYQELHDDVCRLSNLLRSYGVRKGDAVAIYMPVVPDICVAMLACARIGAVHTVIFAGFSPQAIHDRVVDAGAAVIITADEGVRGPKRVPLKDNVDEAIRDLSFVRKVLVVRRTGGRTHWHAGRDAWLREEMAKQRPVCPCEWMDAEDPLFFLYTSGSTGKPKGIVHTQVRHSSICFFFFHFFFPRLVTCFTRPCLIVWCLTCARETCTRAWQIWAGSRVTRTYCTGRCATEPPRCSSSPLRCTPTPGATGPPSRHDNII